MSAVSVADSVQFQERPAEIRVVNSESAASKQAWAAPNYTAEARLRVIGAPLRSSGPRSSHAKVLSDAVVAAAPQAQHLVQVWIAEKQGEIILGLVVEDSTCDLVDQLLEDEAVAPLLETTDFVYAYKAADLPDDVRKGALTWSKPAA